MRPYTTCSFSAPFPPDQQLLCPTIRGLSVRRKSVRTHSRTACATEDVWSPSVSETASTATAASATASKLPIRSSLSNGMSENRQQSSYKIYFTEVVVVNLLHVDVFSCVLHVYYSRYKSVFFLGAALHNYLSQKAF